MNLVKMFHSCDQMDDVARSSVLPSGALTVRLRAEVLSSRCLRDELSMTSPRRASYTLGRFLGADTSPSYDVAEQVLVSMKNDEKVKLLKRRRHDADYWLEPFLTSATADDVLLQPENEHVQNTRKPPFPRKTHDALASRTG